MFCREIKTLISSYLDGRLDYGQSRLLEEHIASCPTCRHRLGLMEEIPNALQTDRMLAPRPEFTKFVMQQIIVRQQLGTGRFETRLRQVSFRVDSEPNEAPPAEDDSASAKKLTSLEEYSNRRPKTPYDYTLRFSAVAAVAVVMITAGAFAFTQSPSNLSDTAAAVYGGIQSFADTVRSAFNSPVELLTGVVVAVAIMIGLWYFLRRPGRTRS
jgi:anti-sigma factor RsiW